MLWLKISLLVLFAVVALRLVQIQVLESASLKERARRQYQTRAPLPAIRGNLYDRNGKVLVSNEMTLSFAADPKTVGDRGGALADRFSRAFGKPARFYREKLSEDRRFVYLERRVATRYGRMISASEREGLLEIREARRLYHYRRIGGQVIGFTDIDNRGISGLELSLDRYLKGADGYIILQRDGHGRKKPVVDYPRVEPVNGSSALLTIDTEYQAIIEEELARGIDRTQAEGGLAIILDPVTGEILAMANYPPVDLTDIAHANQDAMRNRTITDMFEPGSVFKLVTASAALEKRVVTPDQKFFAENGRWNAPLGNGKTHPISDVHPYGLLTFQEAIEVSSNIAFAKISDRIGAESLYKMARNYGFGVETGVDLPGEVNGALKKPSEWSGTTLHTMSYGYEVGVTPLQLIAAYAALANRGVLMKPFIVRSVADENQEVLVDARPQVVRRVVDQSLAETLTRYLEGVVERGTGKGARVDGLRIAGKTGTSRKYVGGKYQAGAYTASFVGYFPAEDPKVVCLVMIDQPKTGEYTGGLASAPIFREIATKIYAMSDRFRRKEAPVVASADLLGVPDVLNRSLASAQEILSARGLRYETRGEGSVIASQTPRAGFAIGHGEKVILQMKKQVSAAPGYVVVPNLRGLSVRRAIDVLAGNQLDVSLSGSGLVVSQSPEAGGQTRPGTRVVIRCEPRDRTLLSAR